MLMTFRKILMMSLLAIFLNRCSQISDVADVLRYRKGEAENLEKWEHPI
jgi:hypothetical protein